MKKNLLIIFMCISMVFMAVSCDENYGDNVAKDSKGNLYATLEEAVEKTSEGETITLLKDVDLTNYSSKDGVITAKGYEFKKGVTLDLNQKTITVNNYGVVWRGEALTIKNGTFNAVENSSKNSGYDSYALFIRGTNDDNNLKDDTRKEWVATVENVKCRGGINVGCHKLIIRNSEVEGTNYYAFFADTNAEITIESGTYTSTSTDAGCVLSTGDGGTSSIIIKDGKFTGSEKVSVFTSENARRNFKITGGTFSENPNSFLVEGYKAEKNESAGTWTVVQDVQE